MEQITITSLSELPKVGSEDIEYDFVAGGKKASNDKEHYYIRWENFDTTIKKKIGLKGCYYVANTETSKSYDKCQGYVFFNGNSFPTEASEPGKEDKDSRTSALIKGIATIFYVDITTGEEYAVTGTSMLSFEDLVELYGEDPKEESPKNNDK